MKSGRTWIHNTGMLYLTTLVKALMPLLVLPYLARILSVERYGMVAFVRAAMVFLSLVLDHGYLLSATKEVAEGGANACSLSDVFSRTGCAKGFLTMLSIFVVFLLGLHPMLQGQHAFLWLSWLAAVLGSFLPEYLYRGIERMGRYAGGFLAGKAVTLAMVFLFVRGEQQLVWMAIAECVGAGLSLLWMIRDLRRKNGIVFRLQPLFLILQSLKRSSVYFVSMIATSALGTLTTLSVGFFLDAHAVALWGVAMQVVSAIQSLYAPIVNGLYPQMMARKELRLIQGVLRCALPLVGIGCLLLLPLAPVALSLLGGMEYAQASPVLRLLLPVLFCSFPAMMLGFPLLGALGKERLVTRSTLIAGGFQMAGMLLLALGGVFSLPALALLRSISEMLLLGFRLWYCRRMLPQRKIAKWA